MPRFKSVGRNGPHKILGGLATAFNIISLIATNPDVWFDSSAISFSCNKKLYLTTPCPSLSLRFKNESQPPGKGFPYCSVYPFFMKNPLTRGQTRQERKMRTAWRHIKKGCPKTSFFSYQVCASKLF